MSVETKAKSDQSLIFNLRIFLEKLGSGLKIAAYNPLPSEPGGPLLLSSLKDAGHQVWIPVSLNDGELAWGEYTDENSLVPGALGIKEPAPPHLPTASLADCTVIVVPALAVNAQGFRLGKGAGYYDRALSQLPLDSADGPVTVCLVYSHELSDAVPVEPHDFPVGTVVTELSEHSCH